MEGRCLSDAIDGVWQSLDKMALALEEYSKLQRERLAAEIRIATELQELRGEFINYAEARLNVLR